MLDGRTVVVVLAGLAAACGGRPNRGGAEAGDVPSDNGDGPTGSSISGTQIDDHVSYSAAGTVVVTPAPVDLSAATIEALVWDGTSFTTHAGTGDASGAFTIPGVPVGPYTLRVDSRYVVTSARSVDLGTDSLGRPDVVMATASPTNVVLDLTGLNSWQDTDEVQMYCANAAAWALPLSAAGALPVRGDTSLNGLTFDWTSSGATTLPDAARGDVTYVTQLISRLTSSGVAVLALGKVFGPSAVTIVDGATTTVSGMFGDVPQIQSITINWLRTAFEALAPGVNPGAISAGQVLFVDALPGGLDRGWIGDAPDLVVVDSNDGTTDLNLGTIAYGNPYPADWGVFAGALSTFLVRYLLPGTTTPANVFTSITYQADTATFAASPVRPLVGPVSSPRLNGADAFVNQMTVGLTPTLSWSPPAVGVANAYGVQVYRLTRSGTATTRSRIAVLTTTATTLVVPSGILQPGTFYFFGIVAIAAPSTDFAAHPFRLGFPDGTARTLTAVMSP